MVVCLLHFAKKKVAKKSGTVRLQCFSLMSAYFYYDIRELARLHETHSIQKLFMNFRKAFKC